MTRVQQARPLTEPQKTEIRSRLCLVAEDGSVDEARCPAAARASEVKFSPGGDKVTTRYEVEPDLPTIAKQLGGLPGIELRAGAHNPLVVSERDHKVELQLKSKGD